MSPNHFDQNVQVVQHKRAQTITQYPDGRVAYRETEKITTTGAQFDPHASPRLGPQKASLMERVLIAGKNKLLGSSDDASPRPGRPRRRDQSPRIANREYNDDELVAATNALSLHPSPHSPGEQRQFLPPLSPLGPYSPLYAQAQLSPLVSPQNRHRQLQPPASPAPVIPMMMHSPQPPPSPVIPFYPVGNLPVAVASSTTAYYPTGPPTYVTPAPVNPHSPLRASFVPPPSPLVGHNAHNMTGNQGYIRPPVSPLHQAHFAPNHGAFIEELDEDYEEDDYRDRRGPY